MRALRGDLYPLSNFRGSILRKWFWKCVVESDGLPLRPAAAERLFSFGPSGDHCKFGTLVHLVGSLF